MFSLFDVVNELLAYAKREDDSDEDSEDCYGLVKTQRQASGSRRSIVRRIGRHMPARRKKTFRNRSLVRVIGSALPLKPCRRAYFQVFEESRKKWTSQAKCFISENFENVYSSKVPTLADVGGLLDAANTKCDEEKTTILTRANQQASGLDLIKCEYDGDDSWLTEYDDSDCDESISQQQQTDKSDQNGLKISSLEQELAQLRMQIASIITNPNVAQVTESNRDVENQPNPPSTQGAPVPPPPPPPPMANISWREQNKPTIETPGKSIVKATFSDILKDISTVKLRSIDSKRSPGGTPTKKSRKPRQSSSNAVDIITLALQKKFAKSRNVDVTPEKENNPFNDSFASPEKNNPSINRRRSTRRISLSKQTLSQLPSTENVNMIR